MEQWIMISTNISCMQQFFCANNNNIEISLYQTLHCPEENSYSYKLD
jgi:hypothetical protein